MKKLVYILLAGVFATSALSAKFDWNSYLQKRGRTPIYKKTYYKPSTPSKYSSYTPRYTSSRYTTKSKNTQQVSKPVWYRTSSSKTKTYELARRVKSTSKAGVGNESVGDDDPDKSKTKKVTKKMWKGTKKGFKGIKKKWNEDKNKKKKKEEDRKRVTPTEDGISQMCRKAYNERRDKESSLGNPNAAYDSYEALSPVCKSWFGPGPRRHQTDNEERNICQWKWKKLLQKHGLVPQTSTYEVARELSSHCRKVLGF